MAQNDPLFAILDDLSRSAIKLRKAITHAEQFPGDPLAEHNAEYARGYLADTVKRFQSLVEPVSSHSHSGDESQPWLQEREDHPLGGGEHTFKVTVVMRGSGADWESALTTVQEKAFSLPVALAQASRRPMRDWFEDQLTEERNADHGQALRIAEGSAGDRACLHLHQTDTAADDAFAEPVWVCDDCWKVQEKND